MALHRLGPVLLTEGIRKGPCLVLKKNPTHALHRGVLLQHVQNCLVSRSKFSRGSGSKFSN